jgi:glycerol-3-phosphate O-acyltransferase/dihydroxyacetone phosphate acyltransferase
MADGVMAGFARLLIHVFFRGIEVEYPEHLPPSGPVVVVANHRNGLVDGLLLMSTLSRYPRFLGKSTLFKITPLWPFLKFAGVVPVYRSIDGARGDKNASAFATCHRILAQGGVAAVFPEGISHDESSLQPLKTGAARIALEAGAAGVADVVTVAVGLTYDAKARFRSRALVRIGLPVGISRWTEGYGNDSHEADSTVPSSLSASYVERALSLGDEAEYVPLAGAGHMDMIDPHGVAFREVTARLDLIAPPTSG